MCPLVLDNFTDRAAGLPGSPLPLRARVRTATGGGERRLDSWLLLSFSEDASST